MIEDGYSLMRSENGVVELSALVTEGTEEELAMEKTKTSFFSSKWFGGGRGG